MDSQDLSLNISREMLQHDHQLKLIASRIEKKVLSISDISVLDKEYDGTTTLGTFAMSGKIQGDNIERSKTNYRQ